MPCDIVTCFYGVKPSGCLVFFRHFPITDLIPSCAFLIKKKNKPKPKKKSPNLKIQSTEITLRKDWESFTEKTLYEPFCAIPKDPQDFLHLDL